MEVYDNSKTKIRKKIDRKMLKKKMTFQISFLSNQE